MDASDEEEARKLAACWMNTVKANLGLSSFVTSDLGQHANGNVEQVQECDVIDKTNQSRRSAGTDEICTGCAEYNASDLLKCVKEKQIVYREQRGGKTANINRFKDATVGLGRNSNSEKIHNIELEEKPKDAYTMSTVNASQNFYLQRQDNELTDEDLFDIWGFDDQQRKTAESYLGTRTALPSVGGDNFMTEKENLDTLGSTDKAAAGFGEEISKSEGIGKSSKEKEMCELSCVKICPSCNEKNAVNANWCEECGKAIVSVKAIQNHEKIPLVEATSKTVNTQPVRNVSSSNLNPNCAEFVSAYANTSPEKLGSAVSRSPDKISNFVNGSEMSPRESLHAGSKRTECINIGKYPSPIEKDWRQWKSSSLTDGYKSDTKRRTRNVRKSKDKKEQSSSLNYDAYNSSSPSSGPHSFEIGRNICYQSMSPRNDRWYFHGSPASPQSFQDYQLQHHNSPVFIGRQESPIMQNGGVFPIYHQSLDLITNQSPRGLLKDVGCYNGTQQQVNSNASQGFDFENPVLESTNNFEQSTVFDGTEFSKVFVQSALQQQMHHYYGDLNTPQVTGWPNPGHIAFYQPQYCYDSPGKTYNQSHRVYRKKKVVDSSVESPRTPKTILKRCRNATETIEKNDKEGYTYKQPQKHAENFHPYSYERELLGDSNKISSVAVPPLNLEDLENYDQILTLIRTSRDELLPYLCLPEEVILYIFSFLSTSDLCRCARVCRQFNRISVDESLWKELTIKKKNDLSDETLEQISKKNPVSLTITQCHSNKVTEEGLRQLFRNCGENLQDLDFSACSGKALVGELILLHVSSRCRNLRSLDISWSNVSDIGIQAVSESVERLECICMNGCQSVTDEAIRCIVKRHGQSIRVVEVFGCFNITYASLMLLQQHCPSIETLNIGQCHKVSDASVADLARTASKLENIDLRGCKQIRDMAIKVIATSCPKLSTLVIANCPLVSDASLIAIAANLKNIRCIDMCGCPKIADRGIQALAKSCSKLQMLDFSSTKASDKAVMSLANYCCQTLKEVKMSFCKNITEGSVENLAKKCHRLTLIHLYGCKRIKNLTRIQDCNNAVMIES